MFASSLVALAVVSGLAFAPPEPDWVAPEPQPVEPEVPEHHPLQDPVPPPSKATTLLAVGGVMTGTGAILTRLAFTGSDPHLPPHMIFAIAGPASYVTGLAVLCSGAAYRGVVDTDRERSHWKRGRPWLRAGWGLMATGGLLTAGASVAVGLWPEAGDPNDINGRVHHVHPRAYFATLNVLLTGPVLIWSGATLASYGSARKWRAILTRVQPTAGPTGAGLRVRF